MKRLAYKTLLLSITLLLILLSLPTSALADAGHGDNEYTQTVNGYEVTLILEKPAAVGENRISIHLMDAQNRPITNAAVEAAVVKIELEHTEEESHTSAHGQMENMPTEAPSTAHDKMGMTTLEAGHESGEYAGEILIEASGLCIIRVHLTVQGELTEVDFPVNAAQPQNGTGILIGFLALNVVIIAIAVILKHK
jgi:hypothetical protein